MTGTNASARAVYLEGASDRALEAEKAFFEALRLPNGTYKTTAPGRLRDLDEAVAGVLPAGVPLRILDAGASSGITTLDWVESLEAAGHAVEVVVVDLAVEAELVTPAPGLDLLFLGDGHLLQVTVGGRSRFRPVDGPQLRSRLAGRVFSGIEAVFRRRAAGRRVPVRLVSPRLGRRSNVRVQQHDLMQELHVGTFDVVRAANVLNLCYFDEPTVRIMARNLIATLRPGGLLVVCRTLDGQNHGSVLRLEGGALRVVARVGRGSEIEGLLEAMGSAA